MARRGLSRTAVVAVPTRTEAPEERGEAHKENCQEDASQCAMPMAFKGLLTDLAAPPLPAGSTPIGYDVSNDINDIDRRLDALQQFLAMAKGPPPAAPVQAAR